MHTTSKGITRRKGIVMAGTSPLTFYASLDWIVRVGRVARDRQIAFSAQNRRFYVH